MTGRFGSFLNAEPARTPEADEKPTASPIPAAPQREEKRAFSTRVRPSQKAMLDAFVMDLKRAGWPVSQEGVLEELLRAFETDPELRASITARLTGRR